MRIVFMGANRTGYHCLQELLAMREQVVGIFSMPSSFNISYSDEAVNIARYCSFRELAQEHDIPLVMVEGRMREHTAKLHELNPDVVLVSGWYYIIPKKMLEMSPLGFIGFHPSLLPRYRGGAPLTWALINGERETGMTMFYFKPGVDNGEIIAQTQVAIDDHDTIATLYDKVNHATLGMIREIIPKIKDASAPCRPQDESQATSFPQRRPSDGLIDWSKSTRALYNWIRAQTEPYPGAYTYLNYKKLTVWAARPPGRPNNPVPGMAGSVLRIHRGQGVEVLTGDGSLLLTDVELAGERSRADELLGRVGLSLGINNPESAAAVAQFLEDTGSGEL